MKPRMKKKARVAKLVRSLRLLRQFEMHPAGHRGHAAYMKTREALRRLDPDTLWELER